MLKRICILLICLALPHATFAEAFEAGKDYVLVQSASDVKAENNKVLVMEFFSFGCPWCSKLEPKLDQWVKTHSARVDFKKIPVIFKKDWEYYAKAYYTIQAVAPSEKTEQALFDAILKDKKSLNNNEAMIQFLTQHGIEKQTAESALLHSPSIDLEVGNSKRMMITYKISAIPSIVIQNKYKTDLQMAQSEERFFAILDYLVNKAEKNT